MEILPILKGTKLAWLSGGAGASIIVYWFLRTLRWFVLLKSLKVQVNFYDLYLCSAMSLAFSNITPFRSRETLKVELLKRHGLAGRMPGYSSFLMERVIDVIVLLIMALLGLAKSIDLGITSEQLFFIWIAMFFMIITFLFVIRQIRVGGKPGEFLAHLRSCFGSGWVILVVVLLTFGAWTMVAIGWQISLYSVSIDIGFSKSLALMIIVSLISVLSFLPAGIGVSEVGIAAVLIHMGQDTPLAQSGALIIRVFSLLGLCLAAVHWFVWKQRRIRCINSETV